MYIKIRIKDAFSKKINVFERIRPNRGSLVGLVLLESILWQACGLLMKNLIRSQKFIAGANIKNASKWLKSSLPLK